MVGVRAKHGTLWETTGPSVVDKANDGDCRCEVGVKQNCPPHLHHHQSCSWMMNITLSLYLSLPHTHTHTHTCSHCFEIMSGTDLYCADVISALRNTVETKKKEEKATLFWKWLLHQQYSSSSPQLLNLQLKTQNSWRHGDLPDPTFTSTSRSQPHRQDRVWNNIYFCTKGMTVQRAIMQHTCKKKRNFALYLLQTRWEYKKELTCVECHTLAVC